MITEEKMRMIVREFHNEYMRQYREAHRERVREIDAKYKAEHPDRIKEAQRKYRAKKKAEAAGRGDHVAEDKANS